MIIYMYCNYSHYYCNKKCIYIPTVHEATAYTLLFLQPPRANVTICVHGYKPCALLHLPSLLFYYQNLSMHLSDDSSCEKSESAGSLYHASTNSNHWIVFTLQHGIAHYWIVSFTTSLIASVVLSKSFIASVQQFITWAQYSFITCIQI